VDRSPPPPKTTTVQIQERARDEDTGVVELRVTPIHGDTVYAEVGGEATTASKKVENGLFSSDEMEVSFLSVDSTGVHQSGPAVTWHNRVTLKYRLFAGKQGEKRLELQAAPNKDGKTDVRYTTDGSDPKLSGGAYDAPVAIKKGTPLVLACAERDRVQSEVLQIPIDWSKVEDDVPIDPTKPAAWKRKHEFFLTPESYGFIDRLKRHNAKAGGVRISVTGDRWAELTLHELVELDAVQLGDAVEAIRRLPVTGNGQVELAASQLTFPTGQHLLDWLNEARIEVKAGEVRQ
jgi:hypothetical protein